MTIKDEERSEISKHEVLVYRVFVDNKDKWLSNQEAGEVLKGSVKLRTVRQHTLRLVRLGILDFADVFPAHRFRLSKKGSNRNLAYLTRLKRAMDVFGL